MSCSVQNDAHHTAPNAWSGGKQQRKCHANYKKHYNKQVKYYNNHK